jgi:hypothetical protein
VVGAFGINTFGRLRLHTTNLVSVFILLGTLFIAYEGTSALRCCSAGDSGAVPGGPTKPTP